MTTQGVENPLEPTRWMDASRACQLAGSVRALPLPHSGENDECLAMIIDGDSAGYKFYDFTTSPKECVFLASSATYGGNIELHIDEPDGELIGRCELTETGAWTEFAEFICPVSQVSGVHALWLVFRGGSGRLFDLKGFCFNY